jgi:SAM-dependent methyltransferase
MHPQEIPVRPLKARERHQLRKRSFDTAAAQYDKFRPGYPEALFDDLVRLSGIPAGGRILEIGPGTGQATLPLARRGFSITGIEMGASMARLCRKNLREYPNVEILNIAFENWNPGDHARRWGLYRASSRSEELSPFSPSGGDMLPKMGTVPDCGRALAAGDCPHFRSQAAPGQFDLVLAATAFHWIPAKLGFTRCAGILKPHGSLALLWNFPDIPDNEFYNDLRAVYRRVAPQVHLSKPPEQRIERQRRKIVSSGLFGPVTVIRYPWQKGHTADTYIGLLKTMSDHAILAPVVKRKVFRAIRKLIDAHGGSFICPVIAVLFLAPKRSGEGT